MGYNKSKSITNQYWINKLKCCDVKLKFWVKIKLIYYFWFGFNSCYTCPIVSIYFTSMDMYMEKHYEISPTRRVYILNFTTLSLALKINSHKINGSELGSGQ